MNFLTENNPFVRAFTVAANLIILNWLLVFSCIPVITAGAAITAVHTVCLQIIRGEESGILSGYFRAFRQNFRQATCLWLFFLISGCVFAADYWILQNSTVVTGFLRVAVLIAAGLLAALWMILWVNAFPIQARYDNKVSATLKNALVVGVAALPVTILMILLRLAVPYFLLRWPGTVPAIIILSMFILFSGIIYLSDRLILSVFRRMFPQSEA